MFASIAITALAGAWIMDRVFKQKSGPDDTLHSVPMKDILTISLPMLMTTTMNFAIGQTGVIMLGVFRSEAEVGYYAVAVNLATLTAFMLSAVNSMAGPKFSELFHSGKMEELFHIAKKSAKLIFWSTAPILLCLILLGKPVIYLLYGTDFKIAYGPMLILIIGQFVSSISGSTGLFMNMTGNQRILSNIIFVAALTNIGMNVIFTPVYGIYGAALTATFSIMAWNVATLFYIKMKFGKTTGYLPILTS